MKTVAFAILASTWSLTSGWLAEMRPSTAYRPTTIYSLNARTRSTMTCMHASKDLSGSSADILLRMVDEIAAIENSGSANQLEKLEQLEHDLSLLVEDEKMFKEPRPPTIPPPLDSLGIGLKNNNDRNDVADDEALAKAEQALRKLRQRLKEEEESLRQAEEALARSREEDETLRKAEQTLQRSREEAEKRKAQAIQLTEQAVASANKTREEKQRAERIAQEIHASKKSNNEPSATMAIQKPRATIPLDWLYGKKDVLDENELVNGDASTDSKPPQKMDQAPPGVPILYDWIQYIDGSISGKVKGSKSFKDGSSVSTSPIQVRAVFGSVVTTASGNNYYLERPPSKGEEEASQVQEQNKKAAAAELKAKEQAAIEQERKAAAEQSYQDAIREAADDAREIRRKEEEAEKVKKAEAAAARAAAARKEVSVGKMEQKADSSKPPKLAKAPNRVPSIVSWKQRDDGGISGQIYGSLNANDGDYIETSPIAEGITENGYVVQTVSGSRYFLSPDKEVKTNYVFDAFNKYITMPRPGGTITIPKEKVKEKKTDEQVEKALDILAEGSPRSTFSLLDLGLGFGKADLGSFFGGGKKAPKGVPKLSRWKTNKDGTITGIITGSPYIDDGEYITTSPIAGGEKKRGKTVTTQSGSKYFLG